MADFDKRVHVFPWQRDEQAGHRESSLSPDAKQKEEESQVFKSGRLMDGCMLGLTV